MILVAKPEEGARDHLPTTTMKKKNARCFAINNFTILFSLLVFVAIFAFVAPLPSFSTPRSRHRKKVFASVFLSFLISVSSDSRIRFLFVIMLLFCIQFLENAVVLIILLDN